MTVCVQMRERERGPLLQRIQATKKGMTNTRDKQRDQLLTERVRGIMAEHDESDNCI